MVVAVVVPCGGAMPPTEPEPKGVVPVGIQAETEAVVVVMVRGTVTAASRVAAAIVAEGVEPADDSLSPDLQHAVNPAAHINAATSIQETFRRMSSPPGRVTDTGPVVRRSGAGQRSTPQRETQGPRAAATLPLDAMKLGGDDEHRTRRAEASTTTGKSPP